MPKVRNANKVWKNLLIDVTNIDVTNVFGGKLKLITKHVLKKKTSTITSFFKPKQRRGRPKKESKYYYRYHCNNPGTTTMPQKKEENCSATTTMRPKNERNKDHAVNDEQCFTIITAIKEKNELGITEEQSSAGNRD